MTHRHALVRPGAKAGRPDLQVPGVSNSRDSAGPMAAQGSAGTRRDVRPEAFGRVVALLAALMLGLGTMGCASTASSPFAAWPGNKDLNTWVERELSPYLVDQLSRHPRFRGEPILLVSMDGDDVRTEIDALTRDLRSRLTDRLLRAAGVDLYWRPVPGALEHPRVDRPVRCTTASTARYFIGIDIARATGDNYRISVRALDVGAAAWVSGFGASWQGRLTPSQQRALDDRQTDDYLRGLRALPFEAAESDLLAAYLAQNVSCLLRQRGASGLEVFIDRDPRHAPRLQQVLALVSHNLARDGILKTVDDSTAGEIVLSGTLNEIDGALNQLWVTARPRSPEVETARFDTYAYVRLVSSTQRRTRTDRREGDRPKDGRLMSELRVLVSRQGGHCRTGEHLVPTWDPVVERGDCYALAFDLHRPAHVFVLTHGVDGALTLLSGGGCAETGSPSRRLGAGRGFRIDGPAGEGFSWAGRSGVESVYALAVTDAALARDLAAHLDALQGNCVGTLASVLPAGHDVEWLQRLDGFMDRRSDRTDWQAVRVRHGGW